MLAAHLMPEEDFSTFGLRLKYAFMFNEVTEPKEQLMKISEICNVTLITAKKYLKSEKCPRWLCCNKGLYNLSKGLKMHHGWLYDGDGFEPYAYTLMRSMDEMSDYHKNKIFRLSIRLLNNDQKVHRLIELKEKGFISHEHFFSQL